MLSVCVITKNEERHLNRCLSSVMEIANEIIIVDSGSTDDTLKIAKNYEAKIERIDWINDYSFARNVAIDAASEPWILFLDADETLVNGPALKRYIGKSSAQVGGIIMPRHDHFIHPTSNKISTIPIGLVRLFRNNDTIRFQEPVHEIVGPSILNSNLQIISFHKSHIIHHIDLHDNEFLKQKQLKYLQIITDSLLTNEVNHWLMYQKAKTLWFFDETNKALEHFLLVIRDTDQIELKAGALNNIATIYREMLQYDSAIAFAKKSLDVLGKQSQSHFILGDVYFEMKNFTKALSHYLKVQTKLHNIQDGKYIPGGLYLFKWQKDYRLALCYYSLKLHSFALFHLKRSIRNNPNYVDALLLLAKIYYHKSKKDLGDSLIARIRKINPEWKELRNLNYQN